MQMSLSAYPERYGLVLTFVETIVMDGLLLLLSLTVQIIWQYNYKWIHKQRTQLVWQTWFASHAFLVREVPQCFFWISWAWMHFLHPQQQCLQILDLWLWQLLTPWQLHFKCGKHNIKLSLYKLAQWEISLPKLKITHWACWPGLLSATH